MDDIELARSAKRKEAVASCTELYDRFASDTRRWSLETKDQAFLRLIVDGHLSDRALLCNRRVRRAAQHTMIDALLAEFRSAPDRRRYWVTLAWDLGITMERVPQLDLVSLRNVANQHLRRSGLDGIGVVEIDVWKNLTGEKGRRVVAHVHFIGMPRDPENFNRKEVEADLQAKSALRNSLGARSAVIITVGPRAADIAHLGMYMLKAPAAAKNLVPSANGRKKLRPARLPKGSASRLVEILSHIEVGDVLFAIGEGKRISKPILRAVRDAVAHRCGKTVAPSRDTIRQHWRRIRLVNGSKKFRDPIVVTRTGQRANKNI